MADTNRKGSFLLSDQRQRSLDGYWDLYQNVAQYGWFGGGTTPTPATITSVERLDFSNDGTSPLTRGSLSLAKTASTAFGTSAYGWWAGGGQTGGSVNYSTVDRITFSNDTTTATARGNLTIQRGWCFGFSNLIYGWTGSGSISGAASSSSIDRINFANDGVAASARATVNYPGYSRTGLTNSIYGWISGGNFPGPTISSVERLDFANDLTIPNIRGSALTGYTSGFGNTSYGWLFTTGPSVTNRIDYSNDNIVALVRSISFTQQPGTASNNLYGWAVSGGSPSVSTVYRLDFSNDTNITTRGNGAILRTDVAGTSGIIGTPLAVPSASYGWAINGILPVSPFPSASTVQRMDFSNDNQTTSVRTTTPVANYHGAATGNANYGWYGGGYLIPTTLFSTIFRLDYSNDSKQLSSRSVLPVAVWQLGALGNSNYGWFVDGRVPALGDQTAINRLDFSNDSLVTASRSNTTQGRSPTIALGNANYGWIAGGFPIQGTTVERIDYSNDTASPTIRGPLSVTRAGGMKAATSNYGWIGGNSSPATPQLSTVDRIDFSTDNVTASIRGPLSAARGAGFSMGNTAYAWFGGGYAGAPYVATSNFDRIDYSNDSATASTRGTLTSTLGNGGASSNYVPPGINTLSALNASLPVTGPNSGLGYGWFAGGLVPASAPASPNAKYSTVDRVDYSNDTGAVSVRGPLLTNNYWIRSNGTNNSNYGWLMGGAGPQPSAATAITSSQRMSFSNDTSTLLNRGSQGSGKSGMSAMGNQNYGWYPGGNTALVSFPSGTDLSSIDRLDYSNDSSNTIIRSNLTQNKSGLLSIANSAYGWTGGGYLLSPFTTYSSLERLDLSNDISATVVRGPVSPSTSGGSTVGNQNYGWWIGGGITGGGGSSVYRIDYSNDLTAAPARTNLTTGRNSGGGSGNANYGVYAGGNTSAAPTYLWFSYVERINYSNDMATASIRGPLSVARFNIAGLQNYTNTDANTLFSLDQYNATSYQTGSGTVGVSGQGNYGWLAGSTGPLSSIDRIDFANDSAGSVVKGNLSLARAAFAGSTGNANYGWFSGGYTGSYLTTVDRLDYSNDSGTASARANLPSILGNGGGVGNANYGWVTSYHFGNSTSNIVRIEYTNDTSSPTVRGFISYLGQYLGSLSSGNYGYWSGGFVPSTAVARMDFSNDINTTVNRGPTSLAKQLLMGLSTSQYGWWCGGNTNGPDISNVERMSFANDLSVMSARANLPVAFGWNGASGNQTYGWLSRSNTLYRIDYSNDLTAALTRGTLATSRSCHGALSNYLK